MYKISIRLRYLTFVFLGVLPVVVGQTLEEARGSLAGATQQYEKRWEAVQEQFKNDAEFMVFVKREKERRDHFLSYFQIDPQSAYDLENRAILIRDNSKWLNGVLVNPAGPSDSEGLYWEGMGNSLRIKKIEGKHYFVIKKYEYSYGHRGSVAGSFDDWEDGKAIFEGDFGSKTDPEPKMGRITFELRNGLLSVISSGAVISLGGHRAHFDAVYSRVSPLKENDNRLLKEGLQYSGPLGLKSPFSNSEQVAADGSSDRDKGSTQLEITLDASKSYQDLNVALQQVYKEVLTIYSEDEEFLVFLKRSQQAWINYRDAHINAIWPAIETGSRRLGSAERMCIPMELEELTRVRIKQLLTWREGMEEGNVNLGTRMTPESVSNRERKLKMDGQR